MRDWSWVIASLLLLAAGFAVQKSGLLDRKSAVEVILSDCDLRQGGCPVEYAGQVLVFSIEPQDIKILQPLTLSLSHPGDGSFTAERVSVEFEGINMDMGYNRVFLEPEGETDYRGLGMLPSCTAETMHWLIHLIIRDTSASRDVQFRLSTRSH